MSKLSKHNRYQKGKPAPAKALPALGALVAKALPAIKGAIAKGGAGKAAASGGGKGEVVKNLISKFSNKQKNTQENTEQKDFYADQSGGDFSHLSSMQAPFAMRSPFKKKGDDSVTVASSVKGVNNTNIGKYDSVGGTPQSFVAGSSSDPLSGKPNTAAGAVSATGKVNGMEISTTETETSSAQIEKDSKVNPSTGNVDPNPSKSQSNPNTSKAAIEQSESSKKPVIGNETRYGDMHNKHYWKKNKKGKWTKKNDNLWVRDRPDEKEGEITHTNPFNKPKAEKPNVKGGVKNDLNKKTNLPTEMSYRPADSFGDPNAKTKWSKAGLNEMQKYAKASKLEGDEAGYKHYTSLINNTRLEQGLNKTRKTDVSSSSSLGNGPDKKNASLHANRSVSSKINSNIKGNTSNVKDIKMQDVNAAENKLANAGKPGADMSGAGKKEAIKNSNGTFEVTKDNNNIVTNFKTISTGAKTKSSSGIVSGSGVSSTKTAKPSKSKNSKTKLKLSSKNTPEQNFAIASSTGDINTQQMNKMMNGENVKITGKSGTSYVQAGTKSSSTNPKKSTKRKVEKPIKKENKLKTKSQKSKTKKSRGKKGTGLIKNKKNPLFKS